MNKKKAVAALVFAIALASGCAALDRLLKNSATLRKVSESTVMIFAFDEEAYDGGEDEDGGTTTHIGLQGLGSGTVIGNSPYVLTCQHVVRDKETGKLYPLLSLKSQHSAAVGEVIAEDGRNDLALLSILGDLDAPSLHIARKAPDLYSKIWMIASPLGRYGHAAEGYLSDKTDSMGPTPWRVTGFIMPGSSGGTVVDAEGNLIAVPRMIEKSRYGLVPQIGWVVPLENIREFLNGVKGFK